MKRPEHSKCLHWNRVRCITTTLHLRKLCSREEFARMFSWMLRAWSMQCVGSAGMLKLMRPCKLPVVLCMAIGCCDNLMTFCFSQVYDPLH